jgi:two-component sensor histidine kinase
MSDSAYAGSAQAPALQKQLPIRTHLVRMMFTVILWMVVGAILSIVAFRFVAVQKQEEALLHRAQLLQVALDNELGDMETKLQILSKSPALAQGDLQSFDTYAKDVIAIKGAVVALRKRDGQHVVNTLLPYGSPLLPKFPGNLDDEMYEKWHTVYSNLVYGRAYGGPLVVVSIPILVNGNVMALSYAATPEEIQDVIVRLSFASPEVAVIADRMGKIIARSDRHAENVGKTLTDDIALTWKGGVRRFKNRDGQRLVAVYVRSPLSNWFVGVGVPETSLPLLGEYTIVLIAVNGLVVVLALWFGYVRTRKIVALHDLEFSEANHRVKNTLVKALQQVRQAARRAVTKEDMVRYAEEGIIALGEVHDLLVQSGHRSASLESVVMGQLGIYQAERGESRIKVEGKAVELSPTVAQMLGLIFHEMATNAIKHGSLRQPDGRIHIRWERHGSKVRLTWREYGGTVEQSSHSGGSGLEMIRRNMRHLGTYECKYHPDGIECIFNFSLLP